MEPNGKDILLLEWNEGMKRIMTLTLEQAGFRVTQLNHVENLLALLDSGPGDHESTILIIDVDCIGTGREHILRKMRNRQLVIPTIFISPYAEGTIGPDEDVLSGHPVLTTPFSPEELLGCINRFSHSDKELSKRAS